MALPYELDFVSNNDFHSISIWQLSSQLSQFSLCGVVIGKQDVRNIQSKKQSGSERSVLNFTIRDSPNDTINAVCWGEDAAIKSIASSFSIGDVVKIQNPQIITRQNDISGEKFRPTVSSPFHLNISPIYSHITLCTDQDKKRYENLIHCPIPSSTNYLSLAEVEYDVQNSDSLILNLLVAIKEIGNIELLKTKEGKTMKKLTLRVFDQTYPSFAINIWDEETANFLLKYCNKRSILYISCIKASFNNFMKEVTATAVSSTIFTPNPEIPDARVLYQYAQTTYVDDNTNDDSNNGNDASRIYTIEQIFKIMHFSEGAYEDIQGKLYACISSFNIDGGTKISSLRCPGCLQVLQDSQDKCVNTACEIGSGVKTAPPEEMYDINLSLTDHTGTLTRCHISGQSAKNFLNYNVEDYNRLSDDQKTAFKWNYLFERFTINFKISQASISSGNPLFRISSSVKADPTEVATFYKSLS